jgi:integrase
MAETGGTEPQPAGHSMLPVAAGIRLPAAGTAVPAAAGPLPGISLAELAGGVDAVAAAVRAPATTLAYASDWTSWCAFCRSHGFPHLPADPHHLRLYLVQLAEHGGRKGHKLRPRTAERHLAAIAAAHRAAELPFDSKRPILRAFLDGLKRKYGEWQEGAAALRTAHIAKICETLGLDAHGVRNRAILLLGFAGGFRRSELVGLDLEDLTFETIPEMEQERGGRPAGWAEKQLRIRIRRSKTDQTGRGRVIGILPGRNPATCPVRALEAWLRFAELEHDTGPVFRPIDRWGHIEFYRLSDKAVDRIVKSCCRLAAIPGDFSAHSLRAGHVTEAKARQASSAAIKNQTGHSTDAMIDRYDREANLFVNNTSALLGL